ncbi:uncharacterized protein KD926_004235 [Aspergillus affinis]|uniref:uncharacterized protein n=1 Tax=Aspergillus affinis TaxID=1070780 RepID=UPI0022FE5EF5|nr:uncharacterized protein KD926_004235 [Aspergillus affinis]KAI9035266.1 hypothetical protein KD926_004235 [Aspergillus affinis]
MIKPLHILQYNTNRFKDKVMAQFLQDPVVLEADLIFVQEPPENPYQDTTYHPANGSHQLLYPDSTEIGDERARLLELTDTRYLDLWLEPGTTTWERNGNRTTIDLVLLTPRLVACEVNERVHADSDHYPIRTLLDISTETPEAQRRKNWKTCSVKDLQSFVDLNLQSKAFPLQTKQHIELAIEYLIETVNQGIATSIPWANPSFNAECRKMVKITQKFWRNYTESVISNSPTDLTTGLRQAPPDKILGPDGIPNKVWHWLILRKILSRDYCLAKSYRPIALLNTFGKILEAVATVRIAWALKERNLLPRSYLGGRRGISVDYLIQLLLDQIFENWGKGQKVSMLLLDVAGAFDNVSHIRFLHNLPAHQGPRNQLIIKPVKHAKYLGIWLDRTLSFDTYRVKTLAKANGTLEALRSISGSTWGTSLLSMRRIYLAVVVP